MIARMLVLAWALGSTAEPPATWEEARRREAAILREERDALRHEIEEARATGESAKRQLEAEIERLSGELSHLQADNAAREIGLPASERVRSDEAQDRHMGQLLAQMAAWLHAHEVEPLPAEAPEHLPALVAAVLAEIERGAALSLERGAHVFASDGRAHTGDVLHIGEVGAALVDEGQVPVPLVHTSAGWQAVPGIEGLRTTLADGERLRVVLYDPDAPARLDAYVPASWRSQIDAGGSLMWVLFAFGCVAVVVAIERAIALAWIALAWRRAVRRIEDLRGLSDAERERGLARERGFVAQPLVEVARERRSDVDERATRAVLAVRERLFRRLSVLGLLASVAPLVGLLGTVTGMITTFSVVTSEGSSEPALLSGGISVALLTTQWGLAIAIPVVIVHALLGRAARRILAEIEQTTLQHVHGLGDD